MFDCAELCPAIIHGQIVDEYGFDPDAPGPDIPEHEPWGLRGALETITGQFYTAWTTTDAAELVRYLLDQETGEYATIPGGDHGRTTMLWLDGEDAVDCPRIEDEENDHVYPAVDEGDQHATSG